MCLTSSSGKDLRPYEPPTSIPLIWLLSDRTELTIVGFGIHVLVLTAYTFITVGSEQLPSSILAEIDVRFHIAMAACSAIGLAFILGMTITKSTWPLHLRFCLIGMDLIFIYWLLHASRGFGLL